LFDFIRLRQSNPGQQSCEFLSGAYTKSEPHWVARGADRNRSVCSPNFMLLTPYMPMRSAVTRDRKLRRSRLPDCRLCFPKGLFAAMHESGSGPSRHFAALRTYGGMAGTE